jgi:hypothetical protein
VPAEALPPTPPRPPVPPAATAPASRSSTPFGASPLLMSPQRQGLPGSDAVAAQQQQTPPPRVLRAASAPVLPAIGAASGAVSAPASAAVSVAASPQRSLFADMLPPLAPASGAAGASAPQSGSASGVASPTHQSVLLPGGLQPSGGSGGGYGFSGLSMLHQQQRQQQQQAGAHPQQHLQQPGYLQQQHPQQRQQMLGSLTPSALEAAILNKTRPHASPGEDGLGLLPFAVAEAALFDDSPAAAHALPLSVADFVLGEADFGGGGAGNGGGLRDSQGSDFSVSRPPVCPCVPVTACLPAWPPAAQRRQQGARVGGQLLYPPHSLCASRFPTSALLSSILLRRTFLPKCCQAAPLSKRSSSSKTSSRGPRVG